MSDELDKIIDNNKGFQEGGFVPELDKQTRRKIAHAVLRELGAGEQIMVKAGRGSSIPPGPLFPQITADEIFEKAIEKCQAQLQYLVDERGYPEGWDYSPIFDEIQKVIDELELVRRGLGQ